MQKIKKFKILIITITIIIIFCFREDIFHMLHWSYRNIYNKELSVKEVNELEEKLNIDKVKYNWANGLAFENKPEVLIYHHAAIEDISPLDVHKLHRNKGWTGIGYNYYITKDGIIHSGRPESAIGAHTLGNNTTSLGICVEGNLEYEYITEEQRQAIVNLSIYLCLKYDIKDIVGHRQRSTTLCPGKNFPMEEVKKEVIEGVKNYKIEKDR